MCHESTSFALPWPRGVPGGTVTPDDLEQTEAIFIFGQNTSISGPRMRQQSQAARQRDVLIVAFNPCANAPWSPGAPRLNTYSPVAHGSRCGVLVFPSGWTDCSPQLTACTPQGSAPAMSSSLAPPTDASA